MHLMQLLINMHPMAQKMKKPQSAYFHARAVMELAMTPSTEDGIFLAKNLRLGDRKWATIAGADAIVDEFVVVGCVNVVQYVRNLNCHC